MSQPLLFRILKTVIEVLVLALFIGGIAIIASPVWHGRHNLSQDSQAEQILVVAHQEATKIAQSQGGLPDKLTLAEDLDNEEPQFGAIGIGYTTSDVTGTNRLFILSTADRRLVLAIRSASGQLCQLTGRLGGDSVARGCAAVGSVYASTPEQLSDGFLNRDFFAINHSSDLGRLWRQQANGIAPDGMATTITRTDVSWLAAASRVRFSLNRPPGKGTMVGLVLDHQISGQSLAAVWNTTTARLSVGLLNASGQLTPLQHTLTLFPFPGNYQLTLHWQNSQLIARLSTRAPTNILATIRANVPTSFQPGMGSPGVFLAGPVQSSALALTSAHYQPLG